MRVGCIQIATAPSIPGYRLCKAVYSADGLSPCINTGGGGNVEPKILVKGGRAL